MNKIGACAYAHGRVNHVCPSLIDLYLGTCIQSYHHYSYPLLPRSDPDSQGIVHDDYLLDISCGILMQLQNLISSHDNVYTSTYNSNLFLCKICISKLFNNICHYSFVVLAVNPARDTNSASVNMLVSGQLSMH